MFKKLIRRLLSREMISYAFFGLLTTAIDMGSYWFFTNSMSMDYRIASVLSWVLAVIFAFFTNKVFVFRQYDFRGAVLFREFRLFVLARGLSLLYMLGWMSLAVEWIRMDDLLAKVLGNVVVILLNYVASRLVIFTKKEKQPNGKSDGQMEGTLKR